MKLRHLFLCLFRRVRDDVLHRSFLVVIVFSDERRKQRKPYIYGGVSVSQEVLAHKPMLEKYARNMAWECLNVLLAIIQVRSGGTLERRYAVLGIWGFPELLVGNPLNKAASISRNCSRETKGCGLNQRDSIHNYGGGFLDLGRTEKNTPLNWQRLRKGQIRRKKSLHQPLLREKNEGLAIFLWKYVLCLLVSQYLTVAQFNDEQFYDYHGQALSIGLDIIMCTGRFPLHFPLTVQDWCSGVMESRNRLPRTAQEQYNVTQHIPVRSKSEDLVFFLHLQRQNLHHPCELCKEITRCTMPEIPWLHEPDEICTSAPCGAGRIKQ